MSFILKYIEPVLKYYEDKVEKNFAVENIIPQNVRKSFLYSRSKSIKSIYNLDNKFESEKYYINLMKDMFL